MAKLGEYANDQPFYLGGEKVSAFSRVKWLMNMAEWVLMVYCATAGTTEEATKSMFEAMVAAQVLIFLKSAEHAIPLIWDEVEEIADVAVEAAVEMNQQNASV